jgi:hypothetical protein
MATLIHCQNKFNPKISKTIDDSTSSDEEEGSKEKNFEKELEYFVVTDFTDLHSKLVLIQLKLIANTCNLLHSLPYTQEDIKPPRC